MIDLDEIKEQIESDLSKYAEQFKDLKNNLIFKREAYYGLGIDWYGFDRDGDIACITTDKLPLPKLVFADEERYKELNDFFAALPRTTEAVLPEEFAAIKRNSNGNIDFAGSLAEAEKGLIVISETSKHKNGKIIEGYYVEAFPKEKLNITDLPERIRNLLARFYFPINFLEEDKIDISKYFDYEL